MMQSQPKLKWMPKLFRTLRGPRLLQALPLTLVVAIALLCVEDATVIVHLP